VESPRRRSNPSVYLASRRVVHRPASHSPALVRHDFQMRSISCKTILSALLRSSLSIYTSGMICHGGTTCAQTPGTQWLGGTIAMQNGRRCGWLPKDTGPKRTEPVNSADDPGPWEITRSISRSDVYSKADYWFSRSTSNADLGLSAFKFASICSTSVIRDSCTNIPRMSIKQGYAYSIPSQTWMSYTLQVSILNM
jgi:hypothetical protein